MPVVSFGGIIAAISSCVYPVLALPVGIPRYRYFGIPTSFVHYPGIECRFRPLIRDFIPSKILGIFAD